MSNFQRIPDSNDEKDKQLWEIAEKRASDSLRAVSRRNQVLFQWLKNSKSGNEALRQPLTQEEYDRLKVKPLVVDYQVVDHKQGIAPYFRESLRKELTDLLAEKKNTVRI